MVLIWLIYAALGLIFAVSLRRPIGALVEASRQHANLRRELRSLGTGESVAAPEHLSPGLMRIVEETRMLRIALAEPLQAVRSWHAADSSKLLAHVDVGDGSDLDRCDELDLALVNARRAVWDWCSAVERLPVADLHFIEALGLSTGLARGLLSERNALQRVSRAPKKELGRIEQQLGPLLASLDRFEAALMQATRSSLYR